MARRRKMDPERKAFISSLLEHYQPKDAQDIQDMLKDLLGETLQGMLEAEMDDHLGYSKYDYKNKETDDSRNGYSPKLSPLQWERLIWIFQETEKVSSNHRLSKRTRQTFPILKTKYFPCMQKE